MMSKSESERPLSVGGAGTVSADLFEDFDYVALGHLHAPQVVSSRCIYSGSPLKYSFSEAEDVKSVVIVDISDSGTVSPRLIPLTARRDVRNLEGALADLIAAAPNDLHRDDYLRITLTDDGALLNALGRLREAYPNVLQLERRFLQADSMTAIGEASARRRESTESDLFAGFFREVVGAAPNDEEAALFHEALAHPLAEAVLAQAKARSLPVAEVSFSYGDHGGIVSALEPLVGQSGWLTVSLFTVQSLDQVEDHLIVAAINDAGVSLDETAASRLLTLPGQVTGSAPDSTGSQSLAALTAKRQQAIQQSVSERNAVWVEAEATKLESWSDDLKIGLEREIKELDRLIKEARREAIAALALADKLKAQKKIKSLESTRKQKRSALFEAQDQVDRQRDDLIAAIENKLTQGSDSRPLFTLRWRLIW